MIKNFLHKGLKKFYLKGDSSGLKQLHVARIRLILTRLEIIHKPEDMNLPGFDFHLLKGERKGQYAVTVQKNWRIVFQFDGVDAFDVDYVDYH